MLTIAVDAMGGDFGPQPIIEGTLQALRERQFKAILVGDLKHLKPLIPKFGATGLPKSESSGKTTFKSKI